MERANLEALIRGTLETNSEVYRDLKSRHFLQDPDSDIAVELLALKLRTKLKRLADFTALHMFVVTLRCEHSCPYCQVSRQSDDKLAFDMTKETAEYALALTFRSPSPAIKIEFQGGEPLLNFPLIKFIVERALEINTREKRDLQFVVATNLAVLSNEILEFLRNHEILVSTSLDGPRDLHNKNRPRRGNDSYERAISGIERARIALGRDRVGALMTTTEASLERPKDIIDEYIASGFDGIFLRPLSPYGFALKTRSYEAYDADRWLSFYFAGLEHILNINRAGHRFVAQYAATILSKMLSPFEPGYVDLMSPAGIGIAAIVYNYDGEVFASDESRMLAEMGNKKFRLGNVRVDSYERIFTNDTLLEALDSSFAASSPMCSDCAFLPHCGSDPVFHYATQGDFVGHKPTSEFCRRNLAIFKKLVLLLRSDSETRRILTSWTSQV